MNAADIAVKLQVAIQRQDEHGKPVTVEAARRVAGPLRYTPVVLNAQGEVQLSLNPSPDLTTALLEGRVFAATHGLPFRAWVVP